VIATSAPTTSAVIAQMTQFCAANSATRGPKMYPRYCVNCSPTFVMFRIANSQRFQATMKPNDSLKPSLAH
jgi:hypothetical protein